MLGCSGRELQKRSKTSYHLIIGSIKPDEKVACKTTAFTLDRTTHQNQ
jgi:hypothetical protein